MRAGQLDRQITIQALTAGKDAVGGPTESYAYWKAVWAQVIPAAGMERYKAQQEVSVQDMVFRIRWLAGLTMKHRIVYDGENYDILSRREIGRREGLEVLGRLVK